MPNREHIIPEALGGKLVVMDLLCTSCNSRLGTKFEGRWKSDPSIRWAVHSLGPEIPSVATKLNEGQNFLFKSSAGTRRAKMRNGKIDINSTRTDDGSLIKPTKHAPSEIRNTLKRRGAGTSEIDEALRRFADAPEDEVVPITDDLSIAKRSVSAADPVFDGPFIDDRAILKIAYEFLALHLGTAVFDSILDPVRHALRSEKERVVWPMEKLRTPKPRPYHKLTIPNDLKAALVEVTLFGYLVRRVNFVGFRLPPSALRCSYLIRLDTGDETFEQI